jgi:hypothetical protein
VADISVLHNIRISFLSVFSSRLDVRHGLLPLAVFHEIVVRAAFHLDKALFKVRVDHPCRLGRGGTYGDGPAPNFLLSSREVVHEFQLLVPTLDNAGQDGTTSIQRIQERLFTVHVSGFLRPQLFFKLDRERNDQTTPMRLDPGLDFFEVRVPC